MKKAILALAVALTLILTPLLTACTANRAPVPAEIIVSAAASLTDALQELQAAFEDGHPAVTIKFNFGSSGALQQQIEQGAPADVFIPAAGGPMDALVRKNLVEQSAVQTLATNKVVLIRGKTAGDGVGTWDDLKSDKVKRIALGNPDHVPAGQYARAVLEKLNLWSAVQQRLVLGEDVRSVLHYVESGEVQAGIVYSTDAAASQKVVVVAEAPPGSHAPVIYPMAVLKDSGHPAQARAFADYLASEKAKQILSKYGFGQ